MSDSKTDDKEQTFSPRRELLILMQKEPNGATRIRVEDQRDGSLLVERTAFGFEEALFARLQEAKEASSARGENHALQAKIEEFRALKADWDSYGAEAFDPRTIDLAKEIANHLGPSWKCVPCADGPSIWLYRGDEEEILEVRTSYVKDKP